MRRTETEPHTFRVRPPSRPQIRYTHTYFQYSTSLPSLGLCLDVRGYSRVGGFTPFTSRSSPRSSYGPVAQQSRHAGSPRQSESLPAPQRVVRGSGDSRLVIHIRHHTITHQGTCVTRFLINITTGGSGPPRIPWPMAIKTQEQMIHSHLKQELYKAVARATTSRVLGGGAGLARGWWLQRPAGRPPC